MGHGFTVSIQEQTVERKAPALEAIEDHADSLGPFVVEVLDVVDLVAVVGDGLAVLEGLSVAVGVEDGGLVVPEGFLVVVVIVDGGLVVLEGLFVVVEEGLVVVVQGCHVGVFVVVD